MNIEQLTAAIESWSKDKGLDKADPSRQMLKVVEEVGETAGALAKGRTDDLQDGIGDVFVTIVILAQQNNMDIRDCIAAAYEEIAGRTGEMRNGVFVKSEDL